MRFVDRLYNYYRDHLTGDEEDLLVIVLDVLQEQDREDMLTLIHDMDEEEIYQMLGMYMIEMLRIKASEEGIGTSDMMKDQRFH